MVRPLAKQRSVDIDTSWNHLIIDGYVDEPASLGVPPFLAPQTRSLAGGLISSGIQERKIGYMTIDQYRDLKGEDKDPLQGIFELESIVLVAGCIVPGKYLRGTPVSGREAIEIFSHRDTPIKVITGSASGNMRGADAVLHDGDMGVLGVSIGSGGRVISRTSSIDEWNHHLVSGSFLAGRHPDMGGPLICEIETSRGCPRYISGGCSFCIEPTRGPVIFRSPEDVSKEVVELASHGVENIRIGGQSDLISYGSGDVGKLEVPEPDPEILNNLMSSCRDALYNGKGLKKGISAGKRPGIDTGIIHTDNSNPAVIAEYTERSTEALKMIKDNITPGSVLAFGLESSDPDVRMINNLNSTPEQVVSAITIMNDVGRDQGPNGMPWILPGINFLGGLPGQSGDSYRHDISLLKDILKKDLLIRRINIRKVNLPDGNGRENERDSAFEGFSEFRDEVRSNLDPAFLLKILPRGHVIKGIYMEAVSGHVHFGRQIGSYPILAGVEHRVDIGSWIDIAITEVSSRSITGFRTPFKMKNASYRDLMAIPGIGKKRAANFFTRMGKRKLTHEDTKDLGWVKDHILL